MSLAGRVILSSVLWISAARVMSAVSSRLQTPAEAMKCTKSQMFKEDIDGCELHFLAFMTQSESLIALQGCLIFRVWQDPSKPTSIDRGFGLFLDRCTLGHAAKHR